MATRNVVLTERNEALIEALVESGRYQNASEVLREGLRLVEAREAEDAAKLKALREAVQVGLDAVERGEVTRFESMDELKAHLDDVAERIIGKAK